MKKQIVAAALAVSGAAILCSVGALAQTSSACLHDANETAAQKARVSSAILAARRVNTAESHAVSTTGSYQPIETLPTYGGSAPLVIPDGFGLALTAGERSYSFALKDKTDACRFALFSDQDGLIYRAGPLQ